MNEDLSHFSLRHDLRIVHHNMRRIADPRVLAGPMPWQEYHAVRNTLVRVCRRHGPTGPMGECPLSEDADAPDGRTWPLGDDNPTYFIVDDQANDERYLYMEVRPQGITEAWLSDLLKTLISKPFWGVGIANIRRGYLLFIPPVCLASGRCFHDCDDVPSLIGAWRVNTA
jgi:hypothetical protein